MHLVIIVNNNKIEMRYIGVVTYPRYAKQLGLSGGGNFFGKTYIDSYNNGKIVREFSEDVESDELINRIEIKEQEK